MKKLLVLVLALIAVLGLAFAVNAADAEKLTGLANVSSFYKANGALEASGGMNGGSYISHLFDGGYGACYNNNVGSYIITDLNAKLPGGYYVTEVKIYHSNNSKFSLYYSKDGGATWTAIVEKAQVTEATYAVGETVTQIKYVFDTCVNWVASAKEIEIYGMDPSELACLHSNLSADGWTPVPGSATCTGVGKVSQACPDCGEVQEQVSNDVLPLGHDIVTTITKPGTSVSYGEATLKCSRCDYTIDFRGEVNLTSPDYSSIGESQQFTNVFASSIADLWGASTVENLFKGDWEDVGPFHTWVAAGEDDSLEYIMLNFQGAIDLTKIKIQVQNDSGGTLVLSALNEETGEYEVVRELQTYDANIKGGGALVMEVPMLGVTTSSLKIQAFSNWRNTNGYYYNRMVIGELEAYGIAKGCGLDADNHECVYDTFVDYVVAPTCQTAGTATYKCACNATKVVDVEASEEFHNYVEIEGTRVNATCTAAGSYTGKCEFCEAEATLEIPVDAENGHSFTEEVSRKEADCENAGSITYKCANCEATNDVEIKALGHNYGEAVVVPSTCKENGTSTKTCATCNKEDVTVLETTGCTWEIESTITEPTCAVAGEANYVCSVCGDKKVDAVAATGNHAWDTENYVITINPTCEGTGAAKYTCTVCGATKTDVVAALGHSFTVEVEDTRVDATCTEKGSVEIKCANCTKSRVEELDYAHEWFFTGYGDANGENMPTCDIEGIANYKCIKCEATKQETVIHRFLSPEGYVEGKAPTCTEYGYAIFSCVWCTETEERMVEPQHSYEVTDSVYATCTEAGSQTWKCTLCGDSYTEELPANGHNQKWQYDSTTATCTEAGVETYGCYNCDAVITVEVEAYGHEWNVDESTLDLEAHTVNRVCATCEASEAISSLGMEADPINIEIPGSFTASVTGKWTYYSFTHKEGYVTFTFDTDNVNAMVKDTTGTYGTQYFWGYNTTWQAELMESGSYVVAICSNDGSAIDIAVTSEMEVADVPDFGEVPEKPIVIEGVNTAYESTGKVWYKFETPSAGTVTITVEGTAKVMYGTDPEDLAEYTAPFVDEYGWTTYYICVESEEAATIVIDVEAPVGTRDNPLSIAVGDNAVSTEGGWATYYATFENGDNGVLTLTFDSETYANVVIYVGTHPYQMQTYVASGTTIEVSAWTTYYFGISTSDFAPVDFTLTAAFEVTVPEMPEPDVEIGELIGSMEVETTDTYGYHDMYTYTAKVAGQYTFAVPVGLGFYCKAGYDSYADAEIDFNEAIGGYVTVTLAAGEEYSFYVGAFTKDTWAIDVYYLAPEHTCEFVEVERVDSTCKNAGYVKYECTCGESYTEDLELAAHTEVEIPAVRPTPSVTGYTAGVECSVCGLVTKAPVEVNITEMANDKSVNTVFRIAAINLSAQENLSVNFKALVTEGYNNPYVVFLFDGQEYVVDTYTLEQSSGRFVFNFAETRPQLMTENITTCLYGQTADGEYTKVVYEKYSVYQYITGQLKKNDAALTTAMSDVLYMGAMTQLYMGRNTDDLVTDRAAADGYTLTPTPFVNIDPSLNIQNVTGDRATGTDWKAVSLAFGASTEIIFKFETDNLEGLKVKVNVGGRDIYYDAKDLKTEIAANGNTRYVVYVTDVRSYEYNEVVTATFERDGVQVGSTFIYSINTFLARNYQNTAKYGENGVNLMKAIYTYGVSLAKYFN